MASNFHINWRGWLLTMCITLGIVMPVSASDKPLRIGIASMITPVDTVRYYQDIVDYISEKLHMPAEMVNRKTYAEMDNLLKHEKVDAAFICSAPYVRNKREFGVELLVAPEVNGRPFYRSNIIVHNDSEISSVEGLRGKVFAFTDPRSNTGRLFPEFMLAKQGMGIDEFFGRYIYSYSHNKSIELVAKKSVDGAAVESLVYEYLKKTGSPYVAQTRIIQQSHDFGNPPFVTLPGTSDFLKGKLRHEFLNMHKDEKGRAILKQMHIDRFVEVPDSNYDSIRAMEAFMKDKSGEMIEAELEADPVIKFGVIPRDNPRIAYEKYQPLIDYLNEVTPHRFELVLFKSYEETVDALGQGRLDMAFLGPLTYLEARKKYAAHAVLRSVTEDGSATYQSAVVTRNDSQVMSLADLKGKSFAFAAMRSTSGNLFPRYMLAEADIHLKDFTRYMNFNYHDSVVKRLLRGEYDAGTVRKSVADKFLPAGLKIIKTSEPIPTGPLVVGPDAKYSVVKDVRKALLQLKETEHGQSVLQKLDQEMRGGFIESSDKDYQGIRKMMNDVPKTCGLGCHPKILF